MQWCNDYLYGLGLRIVCRQCCLPANRTETAYVCGSQPAVLEKVRVTARYGLNRCKLALYIVNGFGPNLLGRYWLKLLDIGIPRINAIQSSSPVIPGLRKVLDKHAAVFEPGHGEFKGLKVHLSVNSDAQPVFCKPCQVPYTLKMNVEIELLVSIGVFKPVTHSEWATPLVPILKADKQSIRLCGDYKAIINKAAKIDQFPVPKAEDIFAKLADLKLFVKLDLSEADTQLMSDETSQLLATVNTLLELMAVTSDAD